MPPELLTNDELSPATDAFSFGVVLWELMSGRRAWRGLAPLQVINAVTLERRTLPVPEHWPAELRVRGGDGEGGGGEGQGCGAAATRAALQCMCLPWQCHDPDLSHYACCAHCRPW